MKRNCLTLPLLAAAISFAATGHAQAHAFQSGADFYEQFQEGGYVVLAYPGVLLPLVAAGFLAGLWHTDGMARTFPAFIIGLLIGVPAASLVGPVVAILLIVLGIITAALGALLNQHNRLECKTLGFATGLLAAMVSLEGHGLFELPLFIHLGIVILATMVFVGSANLVRLTINRLEHPIITIGFRVAASWIAAMLVLFLAFEFRG